jgi:hypothetical protein
LIHNNVGQNNYTDMIKPQGMKTNTESRVIYSIILGAHLISNTRHCPPDSVLMLCSWDDWLIWVQAHRHSVLFWIETLDTIWYDKQLVKWSASCYGHFTPYKGDPLSTWTVTYMGHKASPHVAKGKKYLGLPGIKPWPHSWYATTVLAKPFCNWLVCTKVKLTVQMLVWTPTIKSDQALWQSAPLKQFRQTMYKCRHVATGSSWLKLLCQYNCTPLSNWWRQGFCS